jgi:hypothetical protein
MEVTMRKGNVDGWPREARLVCGSFASLLSSLLGDTIFQYEWSIYKIYCQR